MPYLNELDPETVNQWLENFDELSPNIFLPFQENEILLPVNIYEALCNNNNFHIRLYMGLDNSENPRVIALSTYELDSADYDEEGFTDLIVEDMIYEVYSNTAISFSTAKEYIDNWKNHSGDENFKYGFIIPRPNLIYFFMEEELSSVKIFFGYDGEIKPMMQKPDAQEGDVVLNKFKPCPPLCSRDKRMTD